jgi:hypothetical protein
VFGAGDIIDITAMVYTSWELFLIKLDKFTGDKSLSLQAFPLRLRAITPNNVIGLG